MQKNETKTKFPDGLKRALVQTDEGYLFWVYASNERKDDLMLVYAAWDELPKSYREAVGGEHPEYIGFWLKSDIVEVE